LILAQGILGFNYRESTSSSGLTALEGLPLYLELAHVSGLIESIRSHLFVRGSGQGWTDFQDETPRTRLPGRDSQDETPRTRLPGRDFQDETTLSREDQEEGAKQAEQSGGPSCDSNLKQTRTEASKLVAPQYRMEAPAPFRTSALLVPFRPGSRSSPRRGYQPDIHEQLIGMTGLMGDNYVDGI